MKVDGTRKARACLDGSKRSAPWLRNFAQTYASCIEMPCMRLFLSLSATLGYIITVADTSNAFQQSPSPSVACFMSIDDAYRSWYKKRFGKDIDPDKYVVPLLKALQGHPEAGALWSTKINDLLLNKFGFRTTTHERNLYRGTVDGRMS